MIQQLKPIGDQSKIEIMANIITEINSVKCFYIVLNLLVFENVKRYGRIGYNVGFSIINIQAISVS